MKQKNENISQMSGEVEMHPAWQGKITLSEIAQLLSNQQPFTYVLSGSGPEDYYLSYANRQGTEIKHIHFGKVYIKKKNHMIQGYRNMTDLNFYTVEALIRYKTKGKGLPLEPSSLKLSA
jgi:hypothetical protein